MGKKIDLIGQRFGKLVVIKENPIKTKQGSIRWDCQCDCGNITTVSSDNLRQGRTVSCGCYTKEKLGKNLVGKKFGKLTVLKENKNYRKENKVTTHGIYWDCICDCGKEVTVLGGQLLSGHTSTCGCFRKKDLANQKFGKLTVIRPTNKQRKDGCVIWQCKCDCGNYTEVASTELIQGNVISCGCLKSIGEQQIENILQNNKIKYIHDKAYFQDLRTTNGGIGRYDFILLNEENMPYRLIEFDGIQHYQSFDYFGGNKQFEIQRKNDEIKNRYAYNHNLPLVRIPYWKKDNLTLSDLLENNFLVKGKENEIH